MEICIKIELRPSLFAIGRSITQVETVNALYFCSESAAANALMSDIVLQNSGGAALAAPQSYPSVQVTEVTGASYPNSRNYKSKRNSSRGRSLTPGSSHNSFRPHTSPHTTGRRANIHRVRDLHDKTLSVHLRALHDKRPCARRPLGLYAFHRHGIHRRGIHLHGHRPRARRLRGRRRALSA